MEAQIGSSESASNYDFFWKNKVFPLKSRGPYEPD